MLFSIIRIILFIALVVAGIALVNHLSETPGLFTLTVNGKVWEYTLMQGAVLLIIGFFVLWLVMKVAGFLIAFVRFLAGDESALTRFWNRKKERRGLDALAQGTIAVARGDARLAVKKAHKAEKLLQRPDLTRLLNAQAFELSGDKTKAKIYYTALAEDPQTAFIGLSGLLKQAMDDGDHARALKLAERAHALEPGDAKTMEILYSLQSQAFDWAGARETLSAQRRAGLLEKPEADRREAALALAQCEDAGAVGEGEHARALALEAAKLDPANAQATAAAARLLVESGSKRAASKLIIDAWRVNPNAELAAAFAAIEPNEDIADRRRRFARLCSANPSHPESRFLRAELALVAEDWAGAREAIAQLEESEISTRSCAIMAAIARGEGEPDRVVRGWLARALGAPHDDNFDSEISHAAMLPLLIEARDSQGLPDKDGSQDGTANPQGAEDVSEDAEEQDQKKDKSTQLAD